MHTNGEMPVNILVKRRRIIERNAKAPSPLLLRKRSRIAHHSITSRYPTSRSNTVTEDRFNFSMCTYIPLSDRLYCVLCYNRRTAAQQGLITTHVIFTLNDVKALLPGFLRSICLVSGKYIGAVFNGSGTIYFKSYVEYMTRLPVNDMMIEVDYLYTTSFG